MIKGISRQIIEVADTENEYFERAMFFISPCFSDAERNALEKEASRMLRQMDSPSKIKCRRRWTYLAGRMAIALAAGLAIGVVCGLCF